MVRSLAQRGVSNHEAPALRRVGTHGPASFETRFALLRMRRDAEGRGNSNPHHRLQRFARSHGAQRCGVGIYDLLDDLAATQAKLVDTAEIKPLAADEARV